MEISLDSHDPERQAMGTNCARAARARLAIPVLRPVTIGYLSRRCCGWRGPAHPGGICHRTSANGSPPTRAFGAGRRRASGSGFSRLCRMIPISNTCSSTRRTSGSISMEPEQKGDSKTGHRQVARRSDDEDCGARRRTRQSGALRAPAGPASRHHEL
jgi:hypothetical protein